MSDCPSSSETYARVSPSAFHRGEPSFPSPPSWGDTENSAPAPSYSTTITSRLPFADITNAMRFPSCDHAGANSDPGPRFTGWDSPVSMSMVYTSGFPSASETYTIGRSDPPSIPHPCKPAARASTSNIGIIWTVIRLTNDIRRPLVPALTTTCKENYSQRPCSNQLQASPELSSFRILDSGDRPI